MDGIAGLTLNRADNSVLVASGLQLINVPMCHLAAFINLGRSFRNNAPTNDLTASFPPAVTSLVALLLTLEMAPNFCATALLA